MYMYIWRIYIYIYSPPLPSTRLQSRLECEECKRKLTKQNSKSILSVRSLKHHVTGQEDVTRNKYRRAAARLKADIVVRVGMGDAYVCMCVWGFIKGGVDG